MEVVRVDKLERPGIRITSVKRPGDVYGAAAVPAGRCLDSQSRRQREEGDKGADLGEHGGGREGTFEDVEENKEGFEESRRRNTKENLPDAFTLVMRHRVTIFTPYILIQTSAGASGRSYLPKTALAQYFIPGMTCR